MGFPESGSMTLEAEPGTMAVVQVKGEILQMMGSWVKGLRTVFFLVKSLLPSSGTCRDNRRKQKWPAWAEGSASTLNSEPLLNLGTCEMAPRLVNGEVWV